MGGDLLVAIIGAFGGLVGGALGATVGPLLATRQARAQWLGQQQVEVYRDAMRHAQAALAGLQQQTAPWSERYRVRGEPFPLADADDVSARLAVVGHSRVTAAWKAFTSVMERGEWDVATHQLESDDDDVVALRQAVAELQAACREAMGAPRADTREKKR